VVASAAAAPLFARAAGEAARRFPGAPLIALVHWRAVSTVPAGMETRLASEYRDHPVQLVGEVRARRPLATIVVCEGEPGATLMKALAFCCGGARFVVREDGSVYHVPWDVVPLARHLVLRSGSGVGRLARAAGALCGFPVLLVGAWRWRRRS
jgi:hypothetical protein